MRYCGICGRERTDNARFCGTCGSEFRDEDAANEGAAGAEVDTDLPDEPAGEPPTDATRWDPTVTQWNPPADATRADPVPEAGRPGPAGAGTGSAPASAPDPFATWYQQEGAEAAGGGAPGAGAAGAGAGHTWEQPTQTVRRTSEQPPFQPAPPFQQAQPPFPQQGPPGYPPAGYPPTGYPPAGPPANRSRKGLIALFAVVLVLIGGGAYALASTLGKQSGAAPAPTTSVTASAPASTPSTAGASAAASASTGTSASSSASASPAKSASATASPGQSLVAVAPGVTATAVPQVETLFSRYFDGINKHDYQEYASTLNSQQQAAQPESTFNSGYATTTDSGMTLTTLTPAGNGGFAATVTFTSHQDPADSVDKSACNTWRLTYYLVPQGSGYLIGPAQPGAPKPAYADC